jgi:endonuclease III
VSSKKKPLDAAKFAAWINDRLSRDYPAADCSLDYGDPLQLYVSTVLSAQCTDARVNQVTPALFRECRIPEDYLALGQSGLEERIRSTGFFRNKAKSIIGACAALVERFGGEVPSTMDELLTLPGVGRKTANVILGNAFGKSEGIVVDTHVGRIAQRLGLTAHADPVKIERDLMALFPRVEWTVLPHRLILHGRSVCTARSPRCANCSLAERCPAATPAVRPAARPPAPRKSRRREPPPPRPR